MNKYEEIQYVRRLGLQKLKPFGDGFMARCPVCGDSHKKTHKTRFYILNKRDAENLFVFCHNCGYNNSFKWFLYEHFKDLFKEYTREELKLTLQDASRGQLLAQSKRKFVSTPQSDDKAKYVFDYNRRYFVPADTNAKCIEFCKKRNIPIDGLFYCNHPTKVYGNMLIFPFWKGDKWYGFQGRSLDTKFFHTFSPNDEFKVWNIFRTDPQWPVIVCEAIIDAMSVRNSIAMLGSDLNRKILNELEGNDIIFAFDNDTTGLNKSIKYAEMGYKVFVWPDSTPNKVKDFNDLAKRGVTPEAITRMIMENVYAGLEAHVRLKMKTLMRKRN